MRPPAFWSAGLDPRSRESAPFVRAALTPLASLYGAVTAWRIARARPRRVAACVVCIGNLTVGGTGKTPLAAWLRDHLTRRYGLRTATLSRGYKGRLRTPVRVDNRLHTWRDVGDEALMLSLSGESWIGQDRATAAQMMSQAGVEIILMDDGHQNPSLEKDLSIIVIDGATWFGNGHVIPKGPLREPVKAGLSRANAIIVTGQGFTEREELQGYTGPILNARMVPANELPGDPHVAFAGIGRPEKMFDSLRAAGVDVRDAIPFPDHHPYTRGDMAHLARLAARHDARLITTQKDHMRLTPEQQRDIRVFHMQMELAGHQQLDSLLDQVLADGRKP